jgi:NADH-quinone oxidoreductase subunit H
MLAISISGADAVFLLASLVKAVAVAVTVLVLVPGSVTAERRLSAWIQDRIGPNRVGIPFTDIRLFGLGQALADAAKFLLKEQFVPASVNRFYFNLAPILAMVPALVTVAVIPFSPGFDLRPIAAWIAPHFEWQPATVEAFQISGVIANLDIGLLFVFAVISLSVYGIVLAGWASNSKYPFLGGIRSSAQIISYEIAMGASVVPVFLVTGHLNLGKIVDDQVQHGWLAFPSLSGGIWGVLLGLCLAFSFLVFLIVVVLFFAANMWGLFEIPLPRFIARNIPARHEHEPTLAGHFLTGMFATLLATPCTSPCCCCWDGGSRCRCCCPWWWCCW